MENNEGIEPVVFLSIYEKVKSAQTIEQINAYLSDVNSLLVLTLNNYTALAEYDTNRRLLGMASDLITIVTNNLNNTKKND